jgi:PST family polysaccharide transporter
VTILTSISIPLVLILIRNYIIDEIGLKEAGYWQAMNRISDYYLMFVNSLLVLYVFPRLNAINDSAAFRQEVFKFYKKVMPYFAGVLLLIYLLRVPIINFLLTEEFMMSKELFGWQLIGDFIKVMAMVIALQFLTKKMFGHFIILQVFLFIILYVSSIYFIDIYGIRGAVMAHCVSYSLYFVIILLLFASSLFGVITDQSES